jgi:hypothetical protein
MKKLVAALTIGLLISPVFAQESIIVDGMEIVGYSSDAEFCSSLPFSEDRVIVYAACISDPADEHRFVWIDTTLLNSRIEALYNAGVSSQDLLKTLVPSYTIAPNFSNMVIAKLTVRKGNKTGFLAPQMHIEVMPALCNYPDLTPECHGCCWCNGKVTSYR